MAVATEIVCTISVVDEANTWTSQTFDDTNWVLQLTSEDFSDRNNDWQTTFDTCKACKINCRAYCECSDQILSSYCQI